MREYLAGRLRRHHEAVLLRQTPAERDGWLKRYVGRRCKTQEDAQQNADMRQRSSNILDDDIVLLDIEVIKVFAG